MIRPSLILSFFAEGPSRGADRFPIRALAIIVQDLALLGLVLFFLWRNGEAVRVIGWIKTRMG